MTKKEYDKITRLLYKIGKIEKLLDVLQKHKDEIYLAYRRFSGDYIGDCYDLEEDDVICLINNLKLQKVDIENKLKELGYYD